jgi:single-strand DNA-binding protein
MINKVILVGHLGKDPEVKYLDKDRAVANFSLATNERYTDRNGNRVETTEWHNLEMWDGLAKVAEKYLKKGSLIYIEGKLKTDEWEKDGIKRYTTKIRVNTLNMLDKAPDDFSSSSSTPSDSKATPSAEKVEEHNETVIDSIIEEDGDDLPF